MDLFRRVRWGNVARAAALLTAVGLVLAWPRLRSEPPALPPDPVLAAPAPAREESPEFGIERSAPDPGPAAQPRRARPAKPPEYAGARTQRSAKPRRGADPPRRANPPRAAGPQRRAKPRRRSAAPVAPPPVPAAPAWTPAPESEFGVSE